MKPAASSLLAMSLLPVAAGAATSSAEPPREWIDSETGHRVERLSDVPGTASLYFHQNAYTAEGDLLVVTLPGGIGTIDLRTRANRIVVADPAAQVVKVGRRSRSVYWTKAEGDRAVVFATHLDSGDTRRVATLPPRGSVASLNADETLLLGSYTEIDAEPLARGPAAGGPAQGEWMVEADLRHPDTGRPLTFAEQKEVRLDRRLAARVPMALFTVDTRTGAVRVVHRATDWLNHLQFSPTDPALVLFCHEGPWHKVDRLWLLRLDDDSPPRRLHRRTMNMEIAGHEFFSADGETVWYDLQTPRGEVFWLAGLHLPTGRRTWYALERNHWSVHFNVSPDGRRFAGDGGDAEMVARAPDGKWLYLYTPEELPDVAGLRAPDAADLIRPGVLRARRLVNLAAHDYRLEPNVTFTPDGRRLVFRSNLHGALHTYAVDLEPVR